MPSSLSEYVGIDPGINGGLAIVCSGGVQVVSSMPQTDHDVWRWFSRNLLTTQGSRGNDCAVLEEVTARPGQGVVSMFTFGKGYGGLRMALAAVGMPYETVRPQVWQAALKIPKRKKSETDSKWKDRLRGIAQRLYPYLNEWNGSVKQQRSVSDALLIATYCMRKREGNL